MKNKKSNWLIRLIKWFVSLFKKTIDDKPDLHHRHYDIKSHEKDDPLRSRLGHTNNRKTTRGRYNQYIDVNNGMTKLIRH